MMDVPRGIIPCTLLSGGIRDENSSANLFNIRITLCRYLYFFSILAYIKSPLPISPLHNWLSDPGDQIKNPQ